MERALYIHSPPTIPAGLRLELATFGLRVRLSNHSHDFPIGLIEQHFCELDMWFYDALSLMDKQKPGLKTDLWGNWAEEVNNGHGRLGHRLI